MSDPRPQLVGSGDKVQIGLAANTLVKAGIGRLARVSVTTAGVAGAVYDSATIGGIGAGNLIGVVPAVVGVVVFDWPIVSGIVYAPGAAQVASVSYT